MARPRYLLDSDICIHLLDRPFSKAVERLEQCETGEAVTSAIVFAEVMLGAVVEGNQKQARRLFGLVPVLPFDSKAAERYARLPWRSASFDRLIAAQALDLGLVLVTGNQEQFADIPGLQVEDWSR